MNCYREDRVNDFLDGDDFWLNASQPSLDVIWGNSDDDVYAKLKRRDIQGYLELLQQSDEKDE